MKTIKIFALFCIILSCFSCKKYLEAKPDAALVTPSTLSDLQGLLNDAGTMNLATTPALSESFADDYFIPASRYGNLYADQQKQYVWNMFEYEFVNDWSVSYQAIYNSNLCLEKINELPKTSANAAQWNNVKGSALFYRSYYFLMMVWQHAKAYVPGNANTDYGIVLRLGSDFNAPSHRASVQQSYDQVITDAMESLQYLPDNPASVLNPGKRAAYGLLARTFLSMRQYDSAYKYANQTLELNHNLIDYNTLNLNAAGPFPKFDNPETIFYTDQYTGNSLHQTFRSCIDTTLYDSYAPNDLRKKGFFSVAFGYHSFKGNYSKDQYIMFTGIANDEMLLTRAECKARKNDVSGAMEDLNLLLKNRWDNQVAFVPQTATSSADAVAKILIERRKELLLRGLRLIDIKRLNAEGANITLTRKTPEGTTMLPPNDPRYALKLPTDIVRITGIPQN